MRPPDVVFPPEIAALLRHAVPAAAGESMDTAGSRSLLEHALHAMRLHFGMEVAFIGEFQHGQRTIRHADVAGHAATWQGRSDPLDETYCQRIVDGRLPDVLTDARTDAEALRVPATLQLPVGAHLGVPIRFRSGELYGTFCCFRAGPDPTLNTRDAATMRLFADFLAQILERQTTQERATAERTRRVAGVLRDGQLAMAYQPVVNLDRNHVVAYEALARFRAEPAQGPDRWFADAADAGLQAPLEMLAIRLALADLPRVPGHAYLSLNVSPGTLLEPGFRALFDGAPLARLMLEVTEHACVPDYAAVQRQLAPLRADGLKLAVDDAGAGFASFRHILQLQPDVIKLDASLIRGIDQCRDSRALAAALIRFAEETGCRMVAEGVETPEELRVLRELAVDKAQGYLLGRPGPLPG